jgi:hypothetical protein
MQFTKLIDNNLLFAFRAAGDLVKPTNFIRVTQQEFDFSQGQVTNERSESLVIDCILTESKKGKDTTEATLMFKTPEAFDIAFYDTVEYNNQHWHVGVPLKTDGRISVITVFRRN